MTVDLDQPTYSPFGPRYSPEELAAHLDVLDLTADEAAAAALSRMRDATDRPAGDER